MTMRFNLLDEPWLPTDAQRRGQELGLLALFEQASQIVALAETAPPSLMAQYRLLLAAITHRALSAQTPEWGQRDLRNWFTQGLTEAMTTIWKWRDRFWLFPPRASLYAGGRLGHGGRNR